MNIYYTTKCREMYPFHKAAIVRAKNTEDAAEIMNREIGNKYIEQERFTNDDFVLVNENSEVTFVESDRY